MAVFLRYQQQKLGQKCFFGMNQNFSSLLLHKAESRTFQWYKKTILHQNSSPIASGALEIPLLLNFGSNEERIRETLNCLRDTYLINYFEINLEVDT